MIRFANCALASSVSFAEHAYRLKYCLQDIDVLDQRYRQTLTGVRIFARLAGGIFLFFSSAWACAYQPSADEQARADRVYHAFTQALLNADYATAYSLFHPRLKQAQDLSTWRAKEVKFAHEAGTLVGYFEPAASWHFDPPYALDKGFYVEYRYLCRYAHLEPCRETLVLFSALGEQFQVIRHARSYVNRKTGKRSGEFVRIPGHHSRIEK